MNPIHKSFRKIDLEISENKFVIYREPNQIKSKRYTKGVNKKSPSLHAISTL